MAELKYTLIADGSSDQTLMGVIKWLLDDLYPKLPNAGLFADFRGFKNPPKKGEVGNQIEWANRYYPFDILFYHRDAESKEKGVFERRSGEILENVNSEISPNLVCMIPITMMETWLLFDQEAIKKAAGNRNYLKKISLPATKNLESIANPKEQLHSTLKEVSGLKGRNLKKFNVHQAVHLVAENTEDFSPLRKLSAFQAFEKELKKKMEKFMENTAKNNGD